MGQNASPALPADTDAERSVVGALLLGDSNADIAATFEMLPATAFTDRLLGAVYQAARELHAEGGVIDEITVAGRLETDTWKMLGGPAGLAFLTECTPTAANILHYAALVKKASDYRDLYKCLAEGARLARAASEPLEDIVARVAGLNGMLGQQTRKYVHSPTDVMTELLGELEQSETHRQRCASWPLPVLSKMPGDPAPGDLIIIAGRPSMGKTALATQLALCNRHRRVLFVTVEMSRTQVGARKVAQHSRVPVVDMRNRQLASDHMALAVRGANELARSNIWYYDKPGPTVADIRRATYDRAFRASGIDLVVIDYLQIMRTSDSGNRDQDLGAITRALKTLARDINAPVVLLSQVNRNCESRADKRPMLGDLRECGSIENDADAVLFVYRPGYYSREPDCSKAEIIVAKARNAGTGTIDCRWDGETTTFS